MRSKRRRQPVSTPPGTLSAQAARLFHDLPHALERSSEATADEDGLDDVAWQCVFGSSMSYRAPVVEDCQSETEMQCD